MYMSKKTRLVGLRVSGAIAGALLGVMSSFPGAPSEQRA